MTITIYGYESFQAWKDAGYPGAKSFDENGNVKDADYLVPPVHRCERCAVAMRTDAPLCWRCRPKAARAAHRHPINADERAAALARLAASGSLKSA